MHDGYRRCGCRARPLRRCAHAAGTDGVRRDRLRGHRDRDSGSIRDQCRSRDRPPSAPSPACVGASPVLSLDFRSVDRPALRRHAPIVSTSSIPRRRSRSPCPPGRSRRSITGNPDMDFDPVIGPDPRGDGQQSEHADQSGHRRADRGHTAISGVTGVSGIAFTNNFASPDRATLFGISNTTDQLVRIGGANLLDGGASQNAGVSTAIGGRSASRRARSSASTSRRTTTKRSRVLADAGAAQRALQDQPHDRRRHVRPQRLAADRLRGLALVSRAVTLYGADLADRRRSRRRDHHGAERRARHAAADAVRRARADHRPDTGEQVVAIDTRPATGDLIGVTSTGRLLRINPVNGQSLLIAQVSVAIAGNVARLRFRSGRRSSAHHRRDTAQNLSVVPDTGVATRGNAAQHARHRRPRVHGRRRALRHRRSRPTTSRAFATPSTGGGAPVHRAGHRRRPAHLVRRLGGRRHRLRGDHRAGRHRDAALRDLAARRRHAAGRRSSAAARRFADSRWRVPAACASRSTTYSVLESARHRARHAGARGGLVRADHRQVDRGGRHGGDARRLRRLLVDGGVRRRRNHEDGQRADRRTIRRTNRTRPSSSTLTQPFLGATLGTPAAATLTIVDNDPERRRSPPTVTITTPTADPTYTASTLFLTLAGTAADTDGTVADAWPGRTIAASTGRRRSARRRRRSIGSRPTCSSRRASTRSR